MGPKQGVSSRHRHCELAAVLGPRRDLAAAQGVLSKRFMPSAIVDCQDIDCSGSAS